MINSFLVSLHNTATPPVSGTSLTGDVVWPSLVKVKTYTGAAQLINRELFGNLLTTDFRHFLIAIQLLWVVEESVCADRILADDPRVTYTKEQLVGQFNDQPTFEPQNISRILSVFEALPVQQILTGDLLQIYRSALCTADKLAALICFYGGRDGV